MTTPLLKTKLFVPKPRSGLIKRTRLVEKLNEALDQSLILVLAPAGFGKSTILSEWAETRGSIVAWLSIEEADNDLKRFFSYFIQAVQQVNENLGQDVLAVLQASDFPQTEHLLTILINDLAETDEDTTLILDDYHLIDNQDIHAGIQFLIEHAPSNFRIIIASRVAPPLSLTRFRARGQVMEIRSRDLRFNDAETVAYLNDQMDLALAMDDIYALQKRTEGWITGLHLAALSMQDRDDRHEFIAKFSGSHHYIVDYLLGEVLSRHSEDIQTFLLQTSILDRFNALLCNAVLRISDSKKSIRYLDSNNLFLIPLDDEGNWYRYHHLFADTLVQRLQEREPQIIPDLHRRASKWHVKHNQFQEAVNHSINGGDYEKAAELIEQIGPEMMMQSKFDQLKTWLESLPEDLVESWPWLCIIWAWMCDRWGQFEVGERYLLHAEDALEDATISTSGDAERIVKGQIAAIRAIYALKRADIEKCIQYSTLALELIPVDYFNRGVAFFTLGRAKKAQGDLAGAVLAYEDGLRASLTAGNRILAQVLIVDTGDVQTLQGRLNPAAESFREAIGYKYESSQIKIPYASTASTALANIMRELNDLDSALELLDRGIEIGVANKIVDAIASSYATQVLVHLALGDHTSAKQACDEAARMQREIPDLEPSTVTRTLNSRARCLLAKGEHVEALRYVRESGISIDDEIDYTSEFRQMILARVLIYCGNENSSIKDIKDAHILLRKIIEKTKFAGFVRHQIEALILQALAFHMEGKQDQALSSLSEALELAEPEGYIRIFIDEGTQMQELLGQVEGTDRLMKYVRKLLIAFQTDESEGPKSSSQQLAEPLSKRELEVLRLLQSELTGPEMAQELVISLNTLRTHTKNIYAKLDVTNRRTAVRKAKELDLI